MAGDGRRNKSNSEKERERANENNADEDMDFDLDDNDDTDVPSGNNDAILIDDILKRAQLNAKKTMERVKAKANDIFDDAETRAEELQEGADKDVDERIENLRSVIEQVGTLQQQQSQFQIQALEKHLSDLSRLTKAFSDYVEEGEKSAQLDPSIYLRDRRTLADKTNSRGGREAIRVQKQNDRDQKIMSEAKAFAKAHRDLFRTLDTAAVKEKAVKA